MIGLLADCRHAVRLYVRTPFASAIAVAALALGMAFVSAFLSLYTGLALRAPGGFEYGSRLVTLGLTDGDSLDELPLALIERMSEEMTSLDAVAGSATVPPAIDDAGEEVRLDVITRDYFPGLRPRLHSGRGFELADHSPEAGLVAVISYRYWQDALGGRDVLDTTLHLELQPAWITFGDASEEEPVEPDFRIVGIMAPGVVGRVPEPDVWLPFERVRPYFIIGPPDEIASMVAESTLATLAVRAEGASTQSIVAEYQTRLADAGTGQLPSAGLRFEAVEGIVTSLDAFRESKRQLVIFLAASVLLALVAAANVSLFLLARAPGRRRELGIRLAVGAPVRRLARQLASEAGLLVVASAGLGLFIAFFSTSLLGSLPFLREARWQDVSLVDWRVVALSGLFMLLLTGFVALAPVLSLRRMSVAASSRQISARATFAQRIAGTAQIAIAATLGGAAVAFGWHLAAMSLVDPGFVIADRYFVDFEFDMANVRPTDDFERLIESTAIELRRAGEAIEALPGVSAVGFGRPVPGRDDGFEGAVPRPDGSGELVSVRTGAIDAGYLPALGFRLRHGRAPAESDRQVVLVNEAFAEEMYGRTDVVGETTRLTPYSDDTAQIIGVLEDIPFGHPAAGVEPLLLTLGDGPNTPSGAVVATSMTAARLQQAIEDIADRGSLGLEVDLVEPLSELRSRIVAPDRSRALLTIGAAALVVLLATFGFYGTQRYVVSAGRREYAIHAAIGAGPAAIGRLVLRRALWLSLPGLAAGGLLAFIVVAWLRADYVSREISAFGVTAAIVAGLGLMLVAASLGPAREARRTKLALLLRDD